MLDFFITMNKRDTFRDYVQEQGKLVSQVMKERMTEKEWEKNWGFYKSHKQFLEEEALKKGLTPDDYWAAIESMKAKSTENNKESVPPPITYNLPMTSNAMVGWRYKYKLDRKDPPLVPPMPIPRKQNVIFLG